MTAAVALTPMISPENIATPLVAEVAKDDVVASFVLFYGRLSRFQSHGRSPTLSNKCLDDVWAVIQRQRCSSVVIQLGSPFTYGAFAYNFAAI